MACDDDGMNGSVEASSAGTDDAWVNVCLARYGRWWWINVKSTGNGW